MAQRLIARRKLEEALDIINETIRQDPRYAESFLTRAEVFELMGMHPQAQADRRKAADLRATYPQHPPEPPPAPEPPPPPPPTPPQREPEPEAPAGPVAEEPPPAPEEQPIEPTGLEEGPEAVEEEVEEFPEERAAEAADEFAGEPAYAGGGEPPEEPPLPPVMPSYRPLPQPSVGGAFLRAAGVVLFALSLFAAAGVGIYIALDELNGDDAPTTNPPPDGSPAPSDAPSETGDSTETDGATDIPPTLEEALEGSPYSFANLEAAWETKGLTVTLGEISEAVTGFGRPAVDATLTRDSATMEVSLLLYASPEAKDAEWTLGVNPAPKDDDAVVPDGASVWYNVNAVVIVRVSNEEIRGDALDGFLDTTG